MHNSYFQRITIAYYGRSARFITLLIYHGHELVRSYMLHAPLHARFHLWRRARIFGARLSRGPVSMHRTMVSLQNVCALPFSLSCPYVPFFLPPFPAGTRKALQISTSPGSGSSSELTLTSRLTRRLAQSQTTR